MGDMADDALSHACDEDEAYLRYRYAPIAEQYERGMVDEYGVTIGNPNSIVRSNKKPSGVGSCPLCGSDTTLKEGKFGAFWGCIKFPKCKGSRNV